MSDLKKINLFCLFSNKIYENDQKNILGVISSAFPGSVINSNASQDTVDINAIIINAFATDDCSCAIEEMDSSEYKLFLFFTKENCISEKIYRNWVPPRSFYKKPTVSILFKDNVSDIAYEVKSNHIKIIMNISTFNNGMFKKIVRTFFDNDEKSFFVSYGGDDISDNICKEVCGNFKVVFPHFLIKEYKTSLAYCDAVENFMSEIANAENVIFIISKKFMESSYCMLEFAYFVKDAKNNSVSKKYYPIILDDAKALYDNDQLSKIQEIWSNHQKEITREIKKRELANKRLVAKKANADGWEMENIDSQIKSNIDLLNHSHKGRKQHNDIIEAIPDLINYFRMPNTLTIEKMCETQFADVYWKVCENIKASGLFVTFDSKEELASHLKNKEYVS